MALKTYSSPVQDNELLTLSTFEQSFEGDYNLPEYKPEIQKIIKCIPKPIIVQRMAVGNKATVDGYVLATVLYLTADSNSVYSVSCKLPFSRQIDMKRPLKNGAIISVFSGIQFFNCRVVNKRKIECRGAVNLTVKVRGYSEVELLSQAEGDKCQQRSIDLSYKKIILQNDRQLTLEDQLSIDQKGAPEVLRIDAFAENVCTYFSENRLTIEGSLNVKLAVGYQESNEIKIYDYKLPFSRELDSEVENTEATEVLAQAQVTAVTAQPSAEDEGMVDAAFTLMLSAYVVKQETVQLVNDIYSTEYGCEIENRALNLLSIVESIYKPFTCNFEFSQQVAGMAIADSMAYPLRIAIKEDGVLVAVVDAVGVAVDKSGESVTVSQEVEVSVTGRAGADYIWINTDITSAAFEFDGTVIKGRISGVLSGAYAEYRAAEAVETVVVNEKDRKAKRDFALTIYFAEEHESVWEIAKKYNTAADEIVAQNGLTSEALTERRMLLIPIVD